MIEESRNESSNDDIVKRLDRIESTQIAVENRLPSIIKNLYKNGFSTSNKAKTLSSWQALLSYFIRRQAIVVVISVFSGFIALSSLYFTYRANELVVIQNDLIKSQNNRIEQQTYLQEAERRSSLIFLLGNILDKIDEEVKIDQSRNLSPQLIGNIISLSSRLRPYKFLEADSLISKEVSPERGQLFVSLINSELSEATYKKIFMNCDFSYALIENVNVNIDMDYVNLSNSYIVRSRFNSISLRNSNFENSLLIDNTFYGCDLRYSKLTADTIHSEFDGSFLDRAIIDPYGFFRKGNLTLSNQILSKSYRIDSLWENPKVKFLSKNIDYNYEDYQACEKIVTEIIFSSDMYKELHKFYADKQTKVVLLSLQSPENFIDTPFPSPDTLIWEYAFHESNYYRANMSRVSSIDFESKTGKLIVYDIENDTSIEGDYDKAIYNRYVELCILRSAENH
ncbi:hypothetical protein FUA23_22085 [Neolewinella aurantiaca]|uniref:Pentapeptide repeat-containing protein n=1 Tax=Neolewinella aurantiaca TaxID=2602767 RepID=A0A5C7FDN6_9BACT|nr:pentapeptide repeat-containing protein [Neolewinella aurantiaca]TXF81086.1 hypothetical protein FUA23_22085 [Neolewinella aurantiaca]